MTIGGRIRPSQEEAVWSVGDNQEARFPLLAPLSDNISFLSRNVFRTAFLGSSSRRPSEMISPRDVTENTNKRRKNQADFDQDRAPRILNAGVQSENESLSDS